MQKISKNENISNFDPNQITGLTFDNSRDAIRVHVVDGIQLTAESINMPEIKFPEQQVIKVPEIIKQTEIHQVNVPVIVKEFQTIEVPVIVKEIEYKIIEVPVIVPEIRVIEVEKPVINNQIEYKELPTYVKVFMLMQALATVGVFLSHFLGVK